MLHHLRPLPLLPAARVTPTLPQRVATHSLPPNVQESRSPDRDLS